MNDTIISGLQDLDKLTGGFAPGELIILGGRPGMGKTSFALMVIREVSLKMRKRSYYLSLEENAFFTAERLYALNIGDHCFSEAVFWDFLTTIRKDNLVLIEDGPVKGSTDFISKLKRNLKDHSIELLVIDDMQLLASETGMADCLGQLKLLAEELAIPVLILSQVDRNCENRWDKRPKLTEIRWISAEEAIDKVVFLYRDSYYHRRSEFYDTAEFILAKHPLGKTGTAYAQWFYGPGPFISFRNPSKTNGSMAECQNHSIKASAIDDVDAIADYQREDP